MCDVCAKLLRMRARRWITPVAVLVVAVLVGSAALREPAPGDFVASGQPRPLPARGEFPSVLLDEFEGMLVGQRGKPVVVNVWASWCAPCRTEMPLLQRAADTYAGQAIFLGVASKDDPAAARGFLDKFGLDYPNVFDVSGRIRVELGLSVYPTTYLFSRQGTLLSTVRGGVSEQRLAALIEGELE